MSKAYLFKYLEPKEAVYSGKVAQTVDFILDKQLKNKELWKKFAEQFNIRIDSINSAWRGEYWGKMMRGGCLAYQYCADGELYDALTFAVEELLATQDKFGRISSYTVEKEFSGWDMWGRKYVLTGLQHFYEICKNVNLKEKVLVCMKKTADYICEHIGDGKIDICATSTCWGGVNSCSILEPFVELYKITKITKYLSFAEYIIRSGGCRDGSLLLAVKNGLYPYQYPEVKAYETMSFFEGVLAYYEVTREEKYFELVKKFVEDAYETERTIIGGLGGKEELFDNFYKKQTEPQKTIIQETCVTVTWIRLLSRLYFNTGDVKYVDRIERSALNALWGSLNTEGNTHYISWLHGVIPALPFDSYSPLVYGKRGQMVGGLQPLGADCNYDSSYGCCVCISAAGIALTPLLAFLKADKGFVINFYFNGKIQTKTPNGKDINIKISSGYPVDGKIKIYVQCNGGEKFALRFRKPNWCENATLCGAEFTDKDGYFIVEKVWENEEISLEFPMTFKKTELNDKTAFTYGPLVLALDEGKGNKDINGVIRLKTKTGKIETPMAKELFRYRVAREDGEDLIFTDYASSGTIWENCEDKFSVWLNVR